MTENERLILNFLFEKILDETQVFDDGTVLMATVDVADIKSSFPNLSGETIDQTLDLLEAKGLFTDVEHRSIDDQRSSMKLSLYSLELYGTDF